MKMPPTKQPRWLTELNRFVAENITSSWMQTTWLIVLSLITLRVVNGRLTTAPISTTITLLLWAASLALVALNELRRRHTLLSRWLKNSLYNSITNAQISLLIVLLLLNIAFGLTNYAWTNASFLLIPVSNAKATLISQTASELCFNVGQPDPDNPPNIIIMDQACFPQSQLEQPLDLTQVGQTAVTFCFSANPQDTLNGRSCFQSTAANPTLFSVERAFTGANWGAVSANLTTLLIYNFDRSETWRIWTSLLLLLALAIPSYVVYQDHYRNPRHRQRLTAIWLITPLLLYLLLHGVPPTTFNDLIAKLTSNGRWLLLPLTPSLYLLNQQLQKRWPTTPNESEPLRLGRLLLNFTLALSTILTTLLLLQLILLLIGLIPQPGPAIPNQDPNLFSPINNWGGFLLTAIITIFAIIVSFPIGLILALGRRSTIIGIPAWLTATLASLATLWLLATTTPANLTAARSPIESLLAYWPLLIPIIAILFQRTFKGNVLAAFSTLYIEFVRGVPLITVLFLSSILFPILLPKGVEIASSWRVIWGFTLFSAAYLAENVRGGLQSLSKGQYEAADSLGLNTFDKYRLVILPQALRIVIPALVGQFISLFKDTTLVAIVGLLDILGVANTISSQPQWFGVRREVYLFLALLYYIGSALMTGYSRRLEKRLGLGER